RRATRRRYFRRPGVSCHLHGADRPRSGGCGRRSRRAARRRHGGCPPGIADREWRTRSRGGDDRRQHQCPDVAHAGRPSHGNRSHSAARRRGRQGRAHSREDAARGGDVGARASALEVLWRYSTLNSYSSGGLVHSDVAALLAVQDDDVAIHELEKHLAELAPRVSAMAAERDKALAALQQARQAAEAEEKRRHEVAERVAQHRAVQEKNQSALNSVTSMREATAATAQLEQSKRMIDEDERELAQIGQRLVEANRLVDERERTAADLERAQSQARASLAADQQNLEAQLVDARRVRND